MNYRVLFTIVLWTWLFFSFLSIGSLYGTHFTPAQAAHTSTFKPSETRDDFLPVESYLITPTRSVSSTSTVSTSAEERLSIEARQTMPLYTAPTLEGVAPLSVKGMSLITSFGKTLLTPKPTAHIIDFSSSLFVDERFDSRRITSNSKTETMTKIVASKSIFDAKGSIGMNSTPILPNVRRVRKRFGNWCGWWLIFLLSISLSFRGWISTYDLPDEGLLLEIFREKKSHLFLKNSPYEW